MSDLSPIAIACWQSRERGAVHESERGTTSSHSAGRQTCVKHIAANNPDEPSHSFDSSAFLSGLPSLLDTLASINNITTVI